MIRQPASPLLYYNGTQVTLTNLGVFTPNTTNNVYIGERPPGDFNSGVFHGAIDELSLYNRALSASEIKAIYTLGGVGKFDPDPSVPAPRNLARARVALGTIRTDTIYGDNTNWLSQGITFTATTPSIPLMVTGIQPGMLLDTFTMDQLPQDQFAFPEETLKDLVGDSAYGEWKLEIWDSRAGMNLNAELLGWQLRFILETNAPVVTPLFDGIAVTNSRPECIPAYFAVDVPAWVNHVTNRILFATPPGVRVWFNQTNLPTGTNAGDIQIIPQPSGLATAGSFLLFTNSIRSECQHATFGSGIALLFGS